MNSVFSVVFIGPSLRRRSPISYVFERCLLSFCEVVHHAVVHIEEALSEPPAGRKRGVVKSKNSPDRPCSPSEAVHTAPRQSMASTSPNSSAHSAARLAKDRPSSLRGVHSVVSEEGASRTRSICTSTIRWRGVPSLRVALARSGRLANVGVGPRGETVGRARSS